MSAEVAWLVTERDDDGHPTALARLTDIAGRSIDGRLVLMRDGMVHDADDVVTLCDLDCYVAIHGDQRAAALARWVIAHLDGPTTPEEMAEEEALRAGFARRRRT